MSRALLLVLLLAGCSTGPVWLDQKIASGMPWFGEVQCPDGRFSVHCPMR